MRRKWISFVLCTLLITSGCLEDSPPDMDGDGIQDSEDIDIDGDGWSNSEELNCTSDPNDGNVVPTPKRDAALIHWIVTLYQTT